VKFAPSEFSFTQVQIDDLPLYDQDDDANQAESVKRLKNEIRGAQGLLFVTPEYNRSIPGVLKNSIDHASRPYGQSAWAGKPAGVLGASVGVIGTAVANSICATCLRIWTSRRWVNPKHSSRQRRGCLTRRATSAQTANNSALDGPVCRLGEEAYGVMR